jgi:hypothetical protein
MTYKLLEKGTFGSNVSAAPSITVTKDSFFINKAARAEFGIDDHEYVELLGDDEEKKIGIRLLSKPTLNARKIRSGDGSMTISVQSVIKFLGMAPGRYPLSLAKDLLEFSYDVQSVSGNEAEEDTESKEQQREARRRGRPAKAA